MRAVQVLARPVRSSMRTCSISEVAISEPGTADTLCGNRAVCDVGTTSEIATAAAPHPLHLHDAMVCDASRKGSPLTEGRRNTGNLSGGATYSPTEIREDQVGSSGCSGGPLQGGSRVMSREGASAQLRLNARRKSSLLANMETKMLVGFCNALT
jgi:hypothetical protein